MASAAAAGFLRIIDDLGLLANSPVVALAQLQIGSAHVLQGDVEEVANS
jgi:hypothetical protein